MQKFGPPYIPFPFSAAAETMAALSNRPKAETTCKNACFHKDRTVRHFLHTLDTLDCPIFAPAETVCRNTENPKIRRVKKRFRSNGLCITGIIFNIFVSNYKLSIMKRLFLAVALIGSLTATAQTSWAPAGDRIKTRWAEDLDPAAPLPEYPRPMLVREKWMNLNGLWNYSLTTAGAARPNGMQGQILVPFPIESSLSGVQRRVSEKEALWYETTFEVPAAWRKGNKLLLHFGAVDWKTEVYVNDLMVGSHTGGYTPFAFDITPALTAKGAQKLTVKVTDPTDKGYQPRGKQVTKPSGIWYTPVTGIWQTVWLEPVPAENHIERIAATSDIHDSVLNVEVKTSSTAGDRVRVQLSAEGAVVAEGCSLAGQPVRLTVPDARLWSPDDPYLYDLAVTLERDGKTIDRATSYAALREIGRERDAFGIERMTLNGKPCFQFGPLDQGWWPDGLYTAPTDEALLYDIRFTKQLGFNMIRKHIKVEPQRWYYHCDREGILVWQDMPSGDMATGKWEPHRYGAGTDAERSEESFANYYKEWGEIMDFCEVHPSVVVWVPYNEAWGQYRAEEVAAWTARRDPSRLVNPASGGNYRPCGDMLDLHNYPAPKMYLFDAERINVLGEYGGIGLPIEGHLWSTEKNWGYIEFKSPKEVTDRYVSYVEMLLDLVKRGFSAAVYTQTTDVEGEVNGLTTYDREVIKIDVDRVREANERLVRSLDR